MQWSGGWASATFRWEIEMNKLLGAALLAASFVAAQPASAVTVSLNVVASFVRSGPFGLAYDGHDIWWSQNDGTIHEMTTAGVDTGNAITGTTWSALTFDFGTNKIATVSGGGINRYDRRRPVPSPPVASIRRFRRSPAAPKS